MQIAPMQAEPRDAESELFALQQENAMLREELHEQWEENHFEHCGRRWPHAAGQICKWPLPSSLHQ